MYWVGLIQAEGQDRSTRAERRRVVFTGDPGPEVPHSCQQQGAAGVVEPAVVAEHLELAEGHRGMELPEEVVVNPQEEPVAARLELAAQVTARQAPIRRARGPQDLAPVRLCRGRAMATEVALAAAIPRRTPAGAAELYLAEILRMVNLLVAKAQRRRTRVETLATRRRPEATLHRAQGLNPI